MAAWGWLPSHIREASAPTSLYSPQWQVILLCPSAHHFLGNESIGPLSMGTLSVPQKGAPGTEAISLHHFSDGQILALPFNHHRHLFDLESSVTCSESGVPNSHLSIWAYWEISCTGAINALDWDCILFWHCVPGLCCMWLYFLSSMAFWLKTLLMGLLP